MLAHLTGQAECLNGPVKYAYAFNGTGYLFLNAVFIG
jgi:hypothetical protein